MAARMTRRDWLTAFTTGMVGAMVLDPERLLWVPGEKTIFLPPVLPVSQEPVVYSLWQLGVRTSDFEHPNEFSTIGIEGPHRFEAQWHEVFRTNSEVQLEEQINRRRADSQLDGRLNLTLIKEQSSGLAYTKL